MPNHVGESCAAAGHLRNNMTDESSKDHAGQDEIWQFGDDGNVTNTPKNGGTEAQLLAVIRSLKSDLRASEAELVALKAKVEETVSVDVRISNIFSSFQLVNDRYRNLCSAAREADQWMSSGRKRYRGTFSHEKGARHEYRENDVYSFGGLLYAVFGSGEKTFVQYLVPNCFTQVPPTGSERWYPDCDRYHDPYEYAVVK
jgi:hypothetical protein